MTQQFIRVPQGVKSDTTAFSSLHEGLKTRTTLSPEVFCHFVPGLSNSCRWTLTPQTTSITLSMTSPSPPHWHKHILLMANSAGHSPSLDLHEVLHITLLQTFSVTSNQNSTPLDILHHYRQHLHEDLHIKTLSPSLGQVFVTRSVSS